jgi:hypothetical protein
MVRERLVARLGRSFLVELYRQTRALGRHEASVERVRRSADVFPGGLYRLEAKGEGGQPVRKKVRIIPGETTHVELVLRKAGD